jgi:carbon monoxide dehydrogenase subunit G
MQITSTLTFAAPPETVAAMLVNPAFYEHVAAEIHAQTVASTPVDQGLSTVFTVKTPEVAKRILGATMTVTQTVTWQPATPPSEGDMTLKVAGVPAAAEGPLTLSPSDGGSSMTYNADFNVRIPLVGKKIEQMAQSNITRIMGAFETVGNAWLATSPV